MDPAMIRPSIAPAARAFAVLLVAMSMLASVSAASAQGTDATPAAGGDATGAFPAHIHAGTCETLGDVVFRLNELPRAGADMPENSTPVAAVATPADDAGTPAAMTTSSTPAAGGGMPVASSTTTVDASLDDILGAEHAIN